MILRAEIEPRGWSRPRAHARGGRASIYEHAPDSQWKHDFLVLLRLAHGAATHPRAGVPLSVRVDALFSRPKRLLRAKDPDHAIPMVGPPDADNVGKLVLDALVLGGWLADDRTIWCLQIVKRYVPRGQAASVTVRITESVEEL